MSDGGAERAKVDERAEAERIDRKFKVEWIIAGPTILALIATDQMPAIAILMLAFLAWKIFVKPLEEPVWKDAGPPVYGRMRCSKCGTIHTNTDRTL